MRSCARSGSAARPVTVSKSLPVCRRANGSPSIPLPRRSNDDERRTGTTGARRIGAHRSLFPVGADHAAAGAHRPAARGLRRARHAARGRAPDQRHDGERPDPVPRRLGEECRADGRGARGTGDQPDRQRRACYFGVTPRFGRGHRPVRSRRPADHCACQPVRHDPVQPGLAAAQPRHAAAHRQTQGHRRRADRHAGAI